LKLMEWEALSHIWERPKFDCEHPYRVTVSGVDDSLILFCAHGCGMLYVTHKELDAEVALQREETKYELMRLVVGEGAVPAHVPAIMRKMREDEAPEIKVPASPIGDLLAELAAERARSDRGYQDMLRVAMNHDPLGSDVPAGPVEPLARKLREDLKTHDNEGRTAVEMAPAFVFHRGARVYCQGDD